MPELSKATSVKRAPKGFRTIKMTVPSAVYALLTRIAETESRTPDQQAAHFLRMKLSEVQVDAIKDAYNGAVAGRVASEARDEVRGEVREEVEREPAEVE
jgi:hypothetical protein